jgi:hypothetical protein
LLQSVTLLSDLFVFGVLSKFCFGLIGNLGLQGGGGFSPGKLRSMLLGVEKKRKQEEELDSNFTPRSQSSDMDESGMFFHVIFVLVYLKI